jgi:oxygen-independent coproporphyrinogen-3 oxidase
LTSKAGLYAYEVSNHAKSGCESQHNLIYWECGDYVGIGPGSHGRLTFDGVRYATESPNDPQEWLKSTRLIGSGEIPRQQQSASEHADEYLMMGLRIANGIDLKRYERISKLSLNNNKIEQLIDIDVVEIKNDRLIATAQGRPLLNAIIRELLTG